MKRCGTPLVLLLFTLVTLSCSRYGAAERYVSENLVWHKGWKNIEMTDSVKRFFHKVDSLIPTFPDHSWNWNATRDALGAEWDAFTVADSLLYASIDTCISPEEHQANIRQALDVWKKSRFARRLSFAEFREMILPYVASDEAVQSGRAALQAQFSAIMGLDTATSVAGAVASYKDYIANSRWVMGHRTAKVRELGIYELLLPIVRSDCHAVAAVTCDIMRACGIPTVLEYTPKWPDKDRGHFWCASLDDDGILKPYTAPYNVLMGDWKSGLSLVGKAYRIGYGANPEAPCFIKGEGEYLPPSLAGATISDQTWRYRQAVTLTIPFPERTASRLAYLCFYDHNEYRLSPAAWGVIDKKRHTVTFKQVPLGIAFFPVYYRGMDMEPFAPPFVLEKLEDLPEVPAPITAKLGERYRPLCLSLQDGRLMRAGKEERRIAWREFKPDGEMTDLRLTRKYFDKPRLIGFRKKMKGIVVLGGQKEEGPFDTLARIGKTPAPYLQDLPLGNSGMYRYYKVASPKEEALNISWIEFVGKKVPGCKCGKATPLPRFSERDPVPDPSVVKIEGHLVNENRGTLRALDGNMETFCPRDYMLFDFGRPVSLTAMRYAPRNADNTVSPGDTYSLYCYDGGWQFVATQTATDSYLDFKDVPSGLLYVLVDDTKGVEDLPFSYSSSDGQMFVNQKR